jgi:hypothetical protein
VTGERCSDTSLARGEPLFATASSVMRWVLVEQPGAWARSAPPTERDDPERTASLREQAMRWKGRYLAIRRPSSAPDDVGRTVFVAQSRPGAEHLLRLHVPDPADLRDVSLPEDLDDPGPGWQRETQPLFAVCTHGKHDVCCAVKGRPLAVALSEARPDLVWEVSHIGGDRFAPNVVVLPAGWYFGRVPPSEAAQFTSSVVAGQLPLRQYRGRSAYVPAVQAAQHFAAEQLSGGLSAGLAEGLSEGSAADLVDAEAFRPLHCERVGESSWRVELRGRDETRLEAIVHRDVDSTPVLLTCHADAARHPPIFRLEALRARPG